MSLGPRMITDGRVAGARSVQERRSPCFLTCAPVGLDIAPGAAGRSVSAAVPAPAGAYRLNSDQDRDSDCGTFTLVYGCLKTPQKRHFPPLSAMCSTIDWCGFILCKFNGRHQMGIARGPLRQSRTRVARATKICDDRSMVLFSMFFRPVFTAFGGGSAPSWGARSSEGVALGFVVLAVQAGWRTVRNEMPSNLSCAARGTGLEHGEDELSPVGPRDHGARLVVLSSSALSISVLLLGVPISLHMGLSTAIKMGSFSGWQFH
jgi:hypothetical protein